ncbi:MAG TPA: hypothetical protein VGS41_13210, partial [Chthonomonadales bacterium]|nr:hypothetical protein [Chthonomonadales bacterium]
RIRKQLEQQFSIEYTEYMEILAAARSRILSGSTNREIRAALFERVLEQQDTILRLLKLHRRREAEILINRTLTR